jgi:ABC-type transport system involved in multi-copper enzyme maturation permease subunit
MTSGTSTAPALPAAVPPAGHRAGFGHLLLAEWTKIRSVRSTIWSLISFVIVTVGFTTLLTWLTVSSWNQAQAKQRLQIAADPVSFVLGAGIGLGQLAIAVLGALLMTTEYSTGVIRASLLAVPRRTPMLAAKAVIFAALIFVLGEIVTFGSFFVGSAILRSRVTVSLSDPGVTRAVIGAGLYLTVLGLFALAIGGLIRHSAGAITTVIGVVLVVPILAGLLPGSWGRHIYGYLPSQAGSLITQAHQQSDQVLSPWQGFGVFCIWTALLLAAATLLLKRRDA